MKQCFALQGELELVSLAQRPYLQADHWNTDDFTWIKDLDAY